MELFLLIIGLLISWIAINWISDNVRRANLYDQLKPRLDNLVNQELQLKVSQEKWGKKFEKEKGELEVLAEEKSKGFPWLAKAYADYYQLQNMKVASLLETKSHPALKAAETVKEISRAKHESDKLWRTLKYQIEYYETLFPWLIDFKEDDIDDVIRQATEGKYSNDSDFEHGEDPAKRWLTDSEFKNLSNAKKYQRALDRYWSRKKTRWEIGKDYERFIGYQYESQGWQVLYQGIVEGFADLGRDLIAVRGNEVQVVQCKYWSREKTIHEKHIFQLYGTSVAYQLDNPQKKVRAVFVTSTTLSEKAKHFADFLNISYREQKPLQPYPCIKCNISKKDEKKIYHLPFDQQYDTTVVEFNRGETYVATVEEAELLGYRRAFKWRGK